MDEKILLQFEVNPYPGVPLDRSPAHVPHSLYSFSATNPFYARDRRVVSTDRLRILDAGCGTGYVSLALAIANPGALVTGIDWSSRSLRVARDRCALHGFRNVEFHECSIADVASLGQQFDLIHCNDALYFSPQPAEGLRALASVLAPAGIIRADLHNARQRQRYLRAQELFRRLGMSSDVPDVAIPKIRRFYEALNNNVLLKSETWRGRVSDGLILANHLLEGDQGFTLAEVFSIIQNAGLEFVTMADSARWNLDALFRNGVCTLEFVLDQIQTREDYFLIYDLMNYNARLYDFWCCHPGNPVVSRIEIRSLKSRALLHPALTVPRFREHLERCATTVHGLRLGPFVPFLGRYEVSYASAALLYQLLDGPQSIQELIDRFEKISPVSFITLAPQPAGDTTALVLDQLVELERLGAVYLIETEES